MSKLLIVTFSPFENSVSTFLAKEFAEKSTADETEYIDASKTEFPTYTQRLHEILTGEREALPEDASAVRVYDGILEKFMAADKTVLAFPNWNLGCPPSLVSFILAATRLQKTFICTEQGYAGLLKNKKTLIILSSGGVIYSHENCYALKWLESVLRMNGVEDITAVIADGFEQYPERFEEIKLEAKNRLDVLAENF